MRQDTDGVRIIVDEVALISWFASVTYQSISRVANCCDASAIVSTILQNSETLQQEFSVSTRQTVS
jgi:hypothetical protein